MKKYTIYFVILFITSCTKELGTKEYMNYVRSYEHGLHKSEDFEGIVFDVQYKPLDFIISGEGVKNKAQFDIRKKELEGMIYFTVKLSSRTNKDVFKIGLSSEEEYYRRSYYYTFTFKNDVYLICKGKKVSATFLHYEKSYNLSPEKTFLFGYEKPETIDANDLVLVIEDQVFPDHHFQFTFLRKDIESVPKLKLEK